MDAASLKFSKGMNNAGGGRTYKVQGKPCEFVPTNTQAGHVFTRACGVRALALNGRFRPTSVSSAFRCKADSLSTSLIWRMLKAGCYWWRRISMLSYDVYDFTGRQKPRQNRKM